MPDVPYMIRDPQGNVYGPATMETIRQWIREGRITAAMQLAPENSVDWKPAAAYAELRDLFAPEQTAAILNQQMPPPAPGSQQPANPNVSAPMANYQTPAPTSSNSNVLGIVSLVSGILGVLMSCPSICCSCVGFPLDITAIVLGLVVRSQIAKSGSQEGAGPAKAGLILGIVSIALKIVLWLATLLFFGLGAGRRLGPGGF